MQDKYFHGPRLLAEIGQLQTAFPEGLRHGWIDRIGRYGVRLDQFRLPVTVHGAHYVRQVKSGGVVDVESTNLLVIIPESYGFGNVRADDVYLDRGLRLRTSEGRIVPVSPGHYIEEGRLTLHSHSNSLFQDGWAWLCIKVGSCDKGLVDTLMAVRAFLSDPRNSNPMAGGV